MIIYIIICSSLILITITYKMYKMYKSCKHIDKEKNTMSAIDYLV